MIQVSSNSIFSAFNQCNFLSKQKNNLIWNFCTKNACITIPATVALQTSSKGTDLFNNSHSFYKYFYKKNSQKRCLNKLFFFEKLFLFFWKRIVFRGKSFRVRVLKKNKKLVLNFGYSHWTRLLFFKPWNFFKKRRQSYIIYSNHYGCFMHLLQFFPQIKKINHYTMRGLRFKQQIIGRRFGKVSQHTSIF